MNTKIAIIIPVKNEEYKLKDLLESILSQVPCPNEVIVVDAGSEDNTAEVVQKMARSNTRVRYMLSPGATCGKGKNVGIKATDADILVSIDGGCLVADNWLRPLVDPLIQGKAEHVTGQIAFIPSPVTILGESFDLAAIIGASMFSVERSQKIPAGGASVAFLRSVWNKAGGFMDNLKGNDVLFVSKLRTLGIKHHFAKDSVAFWQIGPGFSHALKRKIGYSRANVTLDRNMTLCRGILKRTVGGTFLALLALWWFPSLYILISAVGLLILRRTQKSFTRYKKRTEIPTGRRRVKIVALLVAFQCLLLFGEEAGTMQGIWDKITRRRIALIEDLNN